VAIQGCFMGLKQRLWEKEKAEETKDICGQMEGYIVNVRPC